MPLFASTAALRIKSVEGRGNERLLTPAEPNEVWHLDLTTLRVLWLRFTVAAVLDGFTRRLVAQRVYNRTPRTHQMAALVRCAAGEHGQPHFVITDHGTRFRKRFAAAMKSMGAHHVRGKVPLIRMRAHRISVRSVCKPA